MNSKLVQSARKAPVIVFATREGGDNLRAAGAEIVRVTPGVQGRPDLHAVLAELSSRGSTRLLVEGGATVEEAFLAHGLADRLEIFRSPVVAGEGGRAAPHFPLENYGLSSRRVLGSDMLESYAVRA
jgi:diaminohydroxyphosphoribosylaminopyrimidine deaminase/5-amino-6-(5-phosphoribosylamino)uracil reductase